MNEPASGSASTARPAAAPSAPALAVPYDELVTTATVGLSRRPLPGAGPGGPALAHAGGGPAPDAADVLLEAAALHVTARRAGMRARAGITPPPPMAADDAPELPARAAAVLRQVLTDASLLADLLTAAAAAGYRAPAPLLPVLLDAATRTVTLRPAVVAALGPRGRWLAARRPQWQRLSELAGPAGEEGFPGDGGLAAEDPPWADGSSIPGADSLTGGHSVVDGHDAASGQATADPAADPRAWETGSRPQRAAYLAGLRGRDPDAARELLAAGWAQETAEERAELLGVLARGLSPADEGFLEAALDDRAAKVRAAARTVLQRLPGSALRQRAAQRAAPLLELRADGDRQWLAAALPAGPPDAAMTRDGIVASPPAAGIGTRSWLLTQVIAAVPLGWWPGQFGLGPAAIVALPVEGDLGPGVQAGWRLAAVRQRDRPWATALLAAGRPVLAPGRPPGTWAGNDELAALLDPGTRAGLATGLFGRVTRAARELEGTREGSAASAAAIAELAAWPGPWPDGAADFVLAMARASLSAQGAVRVLQGLLLAAARNIPATGPRDYAAELTRMAQSPETAYPWLAVLRRAADTLTLRRAFYSAL